MLARIRHYFSCLLASWKKGGTALVMSDLISFCFRRKLGLSLLAEAIDYHVISRTKAPLDTVIKVYHFDFLDKTTDRWVLYAHYHPRSFIEPDVLAQLSSLRRCGYSTVFITSSPSFSSQQISRLDGLCTVFVHRKNVGHDFGSWITGYHLVKDSMASAETVILMNDSCYGPYNKLLDTVLNPDGDSELRVKGISKSYVVEEHLQSYFVMFNRRVINSRVFSGYMDRIRILRTKSGVIRYLEIGGSTFLKSNRVELKAVVDPSEYEVRQIMLRHESVDPIKNPVGTELVLKGLTPFYKRSNGAPLNLPLVSA